MKIYTKKGDKGTTSLVGGKRVSKTHPRLEAYGTVDELICYIGLLRDQKISVILKTKLLQIQSDLMIIAALLACEDCEAFNKLSKISNSQIKFLEEEIDKMEEKLTPLTSFILPGGNEAVSVCHIARTLCRRAERRALEIKMNEKENDLVLMYLNRLSDYLFVLARIISKETKSIETLWIKK
ncbi:MAG: ATP:cob(I)alamin adenosyltransferase [Bacteroidetes bacterium RIFOXYA12_FULL_35_11]|nr:MAG: ATP:cob(I)alamin adenosyltransferase [Bacteroidetes bacterium GWF2_35_48]OFY79305.1 MAG: ATP:cob(I)alamin adenosyltransferase [Bacteroidetes bacterium RIFOXYA12_FULL_35_11]OFY93640.1 MAG: ATP:cob(I)alamin adenosyltransferase [Bacteroidetes bacterium RIFOXYC12_FULL_35_7]HBX51945.1 cob(I)yrinic acid a,c-diamide adenosyltransferase [Bacteroidales bacterium]